MDFVEPIRDLQKIAQIINQLRGQHGIKIRPGLPAPAANRDSAAERIFRCLFQTVKSKYCLALFLFN